MKAWLRSLGSQDCQEVPRGASCKARDLPGPQAPVGMQTSSIHTNMAFPPTLQPLSGSQDLPKTGEGMWQEFSFCQTILCCEK